MFTKARPCKSLIDCHSAGISFSLCKFLFFPCLSYTEATYRHHLVIDGQFVSLDIMDTAGKVGFIFLSLSVQLAGIKA